MIWPHQTVDGTPFVGQKDRGCGIGGGGQLSSREVEVCWQSALPKTDNAGVACHAFLPEGLTRHWDLEAPAPGQ